MNALSPELIPKCSAGPAEAGLKRKTRISSMTLMAASTLVAVVGTPWYVLTRGVSAPEIALFLFMYFASIFSITLGYHRLYSHLAFKANAAVRFFVLFFGAAAFEQSALTWASQHRVHHKYTDTDLDPYNIKFGFFYAHMGWILFWKQPKYRENVKDLERSRLFVHQHEHYPLWALGAGVAFPLAVGAMTGHLLGAFVLSVGLRITLALHSTFLINSMAHTWGSAPYDPASTAKDNWFCAILTNGEGYHNFHHRFPSDYRNGVRWYQWDPTKWLVWALSKTGMIWDLRRTPGEQIAQARKEALAAKI